MKVFVLYGSSRENGNSEQLAELAVQGIECTKVYLREKEIRAIDDRRHTPEGFAPVDDDYEEVLAAMLEHEILLFVTPLYWYGMSGLMKNFIDRWSQSLRDKRFPFKEIMGRKMAYVIITGGDNPRLEGLPLVQQFSHIFRYFSLDFRGCLIGKGNRPGEVLQDSQAILEARHLNQTLRSLVRKHA